MLNSFRRHRLIVYGDLHGCLDELKELREDIAPTKGDIEVALGDVINKGPYSQEMIKYLKQNNISSVLGNHEDKFIRYRSFKKNKNRKNQAMLTNSQQELYNKLDDESFEYLAAMEPFKRFGAVTLLHGGLTNFMKLDGLSRKEHELLMHIRWLDKKQHFVSLEETKTKGAYFWSNVYNGSQGFVVYGHQPFLEPQIDKYALGIDTGCVYGNKLTAAIFKHRDGLVDDTKFELKEVRAHKAYEYKNDFS
jgi:predicted phosphodiesterase